MPGTIRLIDPQGEIRDVPSDAAAGALDAGWSIPTTQQELARTTAQAHEETYGGVGGTIKAGLAAGARGLSVGTSDLAARLLGGEDAAIELEGLREAHPYVSAGAEIGGAIAPALLTAGASTPASAAALAGRGAARLAGGGLRGALAGGVVEGGIQGVGAGVSELALSTDDLNLERAASVLSSNALFGAGAGALGGAGAHAVERGLSRAGAILEERMAARATRDAVPDDLSALDMKGLRAARDSEVERVVSEQSAAKATARSQSVDDALAYRQAVKDANPWLAIDEGEELAQLSKANKTLRVALADDPKGLRESPGSLLKPLRKEEQALEGAIARKAEIAGKLDEIDAKIAGDIEGKVGSWRPPRAEPQADAIPLSPDEYDSYKTSYSHAASKHYESEIFYSKGGDEIVNPALRSGKPLEGRAAKLRDGLDAAFQEPESRIPRDAILYRGVSDTVAGQGAVAKRFKDVKPGDIIDDPAYISSTFDANAKSRGEDVVFTIKAPAGTPALPLRSQYTFEGEMLLPRGTKFRVDSVEYVPVSERWAPDTLGRHDVLPDGSVRIYESDGSSTIQPPIKDIKVTIVSEFAPPKSSVRQAVDLSYPVDKLSLRQVGEYQELINKEFDRVARGSKEYDALSAKWDAAVERRAAIRENPGVDDVDYVPDLPASSKTPGVPASVDDATASMTWKGFVAGKMGAYMKSEGGHAGAMKRLGREWAEYKTRPTTTAPSTPTPIPVPVALELTGRAARRYATFADVKLTKGGSITLKPEAAAEFLDALKQGKVASASRDALDSLDGLLEQNRALQAKIKDAASPLSPRSELTSPRLGAIDSAIDVLRAPKPEPGLIQKAASGGVFGAATAAASAIPLIGQIPGVAHLIGAKAADTITGLVFGRMGKASGEVAARTTAAVKVLAGAAKAVEPLAPVVATKVLQAVRYATSLDDDSPDDDLPALYKRRTDEIKSQTEYDETGVPRMRPEMRSLIAEKLRPVAAINPNAADRLETIAVRRIEHLSGIIPRQPDFASLPGAASTWQPSDMEMRSFARSVAATEDPGGVEERAAHAAISPEDVKAYWAVYPERAEAFKREILEQIAAVEAAIPYNRKLALSMLLDTPLDPSLHPRVLAKLQSQFPLEQGSQGGAQAPRAKPQAGSIKKSRSEMTPAQERQR